MSAPMDGFSQFPLAMGEVYGVRTWDADSLGRLRGRSHDAVWTPGENVATCPTTAHEGVVSDQCGCGFWAYHNGESYSDGVIGVIRGYGRTIAGTKGFRCEKAEVVALAIPATEPPSEPFLSRWGRGMSDSFGIFALTALAPAVFGVTGFIVASVAAFDSGQPVLGSFAIVAAIAAVAFFAFAMTTMADAPLYPPSQRRPDHEVSSVTEARLRRNYPDVQFFTSVDAMRDAFPIEAPPPPPEPSPENDPDFWTRDTPSKSHYTPISVSVTGYQQAPARISSPNYYYGSGR